MRDFFLIQHHPRGLTEAYQENSRRTRAPRHTHYQRSKGATTETLYACRDAQSITQTLWYSKNFLYWESKPLSHLREDFETLRKVVPATSLFLSYMDSLCHVSRGKTGEGETGKRDYRHRARTGCVEKREVVHRCFSDPHRRVAA